MDKRQLLGSKTAKGGFENEDDIAEKFNNYKLDIIFIVKIIGYSPKKSL